MSHEYELGYDDYFNHLTLDENPYLEETQEHEDWLCGWWAAQSDSEVE